jgi:BON domain
MTSTLLQASLPTKSITSVVAALGFALLLAPAGCKSTSAAAPVDDASLSTSIRSRLTSDSALAKEPIQASVQNGVATLTGDVSSDAARALAADDAAQVAGVRTVINNLSVKPSEQAKTEAPAPMPAPTPAPASNPRSKPSAGGHRNEVAQYGAPAPPAPIERHDAVAAPPAAAPVATPPPPPPPPAFKTVTIPAGSTLPIRITQTLDSATTQPGESFNGTVATDIIIDGLVAIPQGTPVTGRVDEVHEAAHYKGSSLLSLELTNLTRKGERIPITTQTYSKEGAGRGKNTAEKVGGGAAVGAILGGIFGGGKGAAIGAASGGALGAGANTVTRGQQVQIPSETLIRFQLTNALAVRASTKDAAQRDSSNTDSSNPDNPNPDNGNRRVLTPQ